MSDLKTIENNIDLRALNKGWLTNPLFQEINTREDFFMDLTPIKNTWIVKRTQTLREKLIEKNLIEQKADKEDFTNFREHFSRNDDEILELSSFQETQLLLKGTLDEKDNETLKDFLIMTYRNNLGYWIAL